MCVLSQWKMRYIAVMRRSGYCNIAKLYYPCTGTCGQDTLWCLWLPLPSFFLTSIFCSCIYVRNPLWIETTVWLYLLYICHTVIHRKLQNVVYMKIKSMLKKRGGAIRGTIGYPVHKYLCTRVLSVHKKPLIFVVVPIVLTVSQLYLVDYA
jgi:hypothetical protein